MRFVRTDGGRAAAGYKGTTRDCVCRSFAIITGRPYQEIADLITELSRAERRKSRSHYRTGVYHATTRKLARQLGLRWVPTMAIGSGCRVHLAAEELPKGRLVCNLSRHLTAVIDGTVHDVFDPSRDGTRCVYGYWILDEKSV